MLYFILNFLAASLLLIIDLGAFNVAYTPILYSIVILYYAQVINNLSAFILFYTLTLACIEYFIYYGRILPMLSIVILLTFLTTLIKKNICLDFWIKSFTVFIVFLTHYSIVKYLSTGIIGYATDNLTLIVLHFIIVLVIIKIYKR